MQDDLKRKMEDNTMLKRFILLFIILFSVQVTALAESDRWVPINGDKLHATRFVDIQTIQYDSDSKTIMFWDKVTKPIIDSPKKIVYHNHARDIKPQKTEYLGDTVLSKYKVKLDKLDFYMVRTVYYLNGFINKDIDTTEPILTRKKPEELTMAEKLFGNKRNEISNGFYLKTDSVIDMIYEHEAKYVCDYLNIPTKLKSSPHNWKFIYEGHSKMPVLRKDGRRGADINYNSKYYICSDLYVQNYEDGLAKFYVKKIDIFNKDPADNFVSVSKVYVDLKNHSVWSDWGPYDPKFVEIKKRMNPENYREVLPGSSNEAIYNAALNILLNKNQKVA